MKHYTLGKVVMWSRAQDTRLQGSLFISSRSDHVGLKFVNTPADRQQNDRSKVCSWPFCSVRGGQKWVHKHSCILCVSECHVLGEDDSFNDSFQHRGGNTIELVIQSRTSKHKELMRTEFVSRTTVYLQANLMILSLQNIKLIATCVPRLPPHKVWMGHTSVIWWLMALLLEWLLKYLWCQLLMQFLTDCSETWDSWSKLGVDVHRLVIHAVFFMVCRVMCPMVFGVFSPYVITISVNFI